MTDAPHHVDSSPWVLYLLECRGGSLYAGITTDLERRFAQHLAGKGARYTRSHPPLRIAASMNFPDRSAASKAESALKKLPRGQKLAFFRSP
ncbi:MAG: GIY-YIG nuclease family protein [Betaproteobacteria bacterium]|nr:GIY-YIG nuclease family protein [Betaproteobacteria bacterium]